MYDFGEVLRSAEAQEKGIDVTMLDLKGNPTDWIVTVAGPDSKRVREARYRLTDQRIAQKKLDALSAAETDSFSSEVIAAAILGWKGATVNGEEFKFTPENAKLVASNAHTAQQLSVAMVDRSLFIKS